MDDRDRETLYPIGAAAQRTGLSAHVLRAWERRYGVVEPSRPHGGSRLYSNADILHFRLLRRLTEAGHSIGQIARLPTRELLKLLPPEGEAVRTSENASSLAAGVPYVGDALEGMEGMDARTVREALTRGVVALSARQFIDGVVLPLLHRVGDLWADGEICPAHEHLLSVQVARVLGWLADTIPTPRGAPRAVAATPVGQRHEFGALLATVIAAEEGWAVTYLGPDLPARDIATAAQLRGAGTLLLSALIDDRAAFIGELSRLRAAVGPEIRILVGGRGSATLGADVERAGARWLPDLESLRVALREAGAEG